MHLRNARMSTPQRHTRSLSRDTPVDFSGEWRASRSAMQRALAQPSRRSCRLDTSPGGGLTARRARLLPRSAGQLGAGPKAYVVDLGPGQARCHLADHLSSLVVWQWVEDGGEHQGAQERLKLFTGLQSSGVGHQVDLDVNEPGRRQSGCGLLGVGELQGVVDRCETEPDEDVVDAREVAVTPHSARSRPPGRRTAASDRKTASWFGNQWNVATENTASTGCRRSGCRRSAWKTVKRSGPTPVRRSRSRASMAAEPSTATT